jgi:hypothetical protein
MATTYTFSSTLIDRARRLLGDTGVDGSLFLLTDEEILAETSTSPFNKAVANLADSLATRFAQYPDETDTPGGHTLKWTSRVKAWQELSKLFRKTSNSSRGGAAQLALLTNPSETKLL